MTLHWWLGFLALVAIAGAFVLTFRTGLKVKPDPNNNPTGGLPPGSGMP